MEEKESRLVRKTGRTRKRTREDKRK